jgi:thioredoxin reductase (NADPH)
VALGWRGTWSSIESTAPARSPGVEQFTGQLDLDADGHLAVEGRSSRTNIPGEFAWGDVVDHAYRQAITAAGSGCSATLDAERPGLAE